MLYVTCTNLSQLANNQQPLQKAKAWKNACNAYSKNENIEERVLVKWKGPAKQSNYQDVVGQRKKKVWEGREGK